MTGSVKTVRFTYISAYGVAALRVHHREALPIIALDTASFDDLRHGHRAVRWSSLERNHVKRGPKAQK